MNDQPRFLAAILAVLAFGAATGRISLADESDFDRCAKLDSDAERLACFDAATRARAEQPQAESAPAVAPEPAAAPEPKPATAATAGATAAAASTSSRSMTKEERRAAKRAEKERQKANREYTAVVTATRKRPYGQVVVTLDNGEVWSERYASHGFLIREGDTVTVRKSRFSSAYRLIDENGKSYDVTRLE